MPNTFELIASSTVGAGGAASIDFTSIPSTYTDLCVKISWRHSGNINTGSDAKWTINSSTSSYSIRILYGTGSSTGSASAADNFGLYINPSNATASTFANCELYIPNYASANYKSLSIDSVTENNATAVYTAMTAGLWSNTSAITGLKFADYYGNTLVQHSTAYLYGVKNA